MNVNVKTDPFITESSELSLPATAKIQSRLWVSIVFLWKYFLGAVLCQSPLLCVLVIGWTYRAAQRAVLKRWWKQSDPARAGGTFDQYLRNNEELLSHRHWPNWILTQNFREVFRQEPHARSQLRNAGFALRAVLRSLWLNFKIGAQGIFNTWVITLPACILWQFAWFAGWNNSFHKGYEFAAVGPLTGLLGVALFTVAMLYLPAAQARQAATGSWQTFYQFRFLWRLIRIKWLSYFLLALLYSLVSIPVMILLTVPTFFPQFNPALAELSGPEAMKFLVRYYFVVSLVGFPAFVGLKLAAARVYGSAVVSAVRAGSVGARDLERSEKRMLEQLGLLSVRQKPAARPLIQTMAWAGSKTGRLAAVTLSLFLWFTFVSQIFISQFFFHRPIAGWMNQPLVQLPYFRYIPQDLED